MRATWADALAQPTWTDAPVWVHGDLHPGNLVVDAGTLSGVIDFGDLTAGDPATDLVAAWAALGPEARSRLRLGLGVDDATWARGRGWAVAHALAVFAGTGDPAMTEMARRSLTEALADRR